MPKYVLHYFDIAGRAEPLRLMFQQAGVDFEDHRVQFQEWPELKKNDKLCIFGTLPALEVDGVILTQSYAISRYLASEFGLNGKTNLEAAKIDMLCDGVRDIFDKMFAVLYHETDPERKVMLEKKFYEEQFPKDMKVFEDKFVPKDGFFMGDAITRADLHFMTFLDMLVKVKPAILDSFPLCKALCDRVRESPKIKKYYEDRKA